MALIKCPECGKEVSDRAMQCIHCGYPLGDIANAETDTPESDKIYKAILVSYKDYAKLDTTRVIRDVTYISVEEANELLDNYPCCIVGNITDKEFEGIKQLFSDVGAEVQCEEMGENDIAYELSTSMRYKLEDAKDTPKMKGCPTCERFISYNAESCPHCGHSFASEEKKSGIGFWGIVGAVIVAIIIMAFL